MGQTDPGPPGRRGRRAWHLLRGSCQRHTTSIRSWANIRTQTEGHLSERLAYNHPKYWGNENQGTAEIRLQTEGSSRLWTGSLCCEDVTGTNNWQNLHGISLWLDSGGVSWPTAGLWWLCRAYGRRSLLAGNAHYSAWGSRASDLQLT